MKPSGWSKIPHAGSGSTSSQPGTGHAEQCSRKPNRRKVVSCATRHLGELAACRSTMNRPTTESPIVTSYEIICAEARMRAEQRPVVVARPARDHRAVGGERADREDVEHAPVDVGDDELRGGVAERVDAAERDHGERHDRRHQRDHRREQVQHAVRAARHHVFLREQLQHVGEPGAAGRAAVMPAMSARLAPMRSCITALCLRSTQVMSGSEQRPPPRAR